MFYNIFFLVLYFFIKKQFQKLVYINNLIYFCIVKLCFLLILIIIFKFKKNEQN